MRRYELAGLVCLISGVVLVPPVTAAPARQIVVQATRPAHADLTLPAGVGFRSAVLTTAGDYAAYIVEWLADPHFPWGGLVMKGAAAGGGLGPQISFGLFHGDFPAAGRYRIHVLGPVGRLTSVRLTVEGIPRSVRVGPARLPATATAAQFFPTSTDVAAPLLVRYTRTTVSLPQRYLALVAVQARSDSAAAARFRVCLVPANQLCDVDGRDPKATTVVPTVPGTYGADVQVYDSEAFPADGTDAVIEAAATEAGVHSVAMVVVIDRGPGPRNS